MSIIVVTQTPSFDAKLRLGLRERGVPVRVVTTLGDAALELRRRRPSAVVIDLRWSLSWSYSLAAWVRRNLTIAGIRVVLSAETPLARDLYAAFLVKEAAFLRHDFELEDVLEAVHEEVPAEAAA
ncbi:MAG: response regulator transcription factor [Planctomycetes bacterium]|nr:response regulator transcription factor [Planctomycetota bacterium]